MAAGATAVGVGAAAVLGIPVADFSASSSRRRPATSNLFFMFSPAAFAVGVASIGVATTGVRIVAITRGGLLEPLERAAAAVRLKKRGQNIHTRKSREAIMDFGPGLRRERQPYVSRAAHACSSDVCWSYQRILSCALLVVCTDVQMPFVV